MTGLFSYILVVCINAHGAECQTRSLTPYGTKGKCEVARMETGLPLPDKNYAPAYRGQDTAWCMPINMLEE